jgi:hypothetical protein
MSRKPVVVYIRDKNPPLQFTPSTFANKAGTNNSFLKQRLAKAVACKLRDIFTPRLRQQLIKKTRPLRLLACKCCNPQKIPAMFQSLVFVDATAKSDHRCK